MKCSWIVVADAGRARIFEASDAQTSWSVVHSVCNPDGRRLSQQLVSDESGRIDKSGRGVLSAMDPRTDPHEVAAFRFAHDLANILDCGAKRHAYSRLTLIAPPHFLGLMKSALTSEVEKRLVAACPKDLTRLDASALSRQTKFVSG